MTRILIIEDMKDLRDDVVEMLNMEGFEAMGAENGLVGIEVARDKKPDLIVCDVTMPEMDGYGVLEEVRRDPETATIPFIFLTARTDRGNVRQGMVLGADDYLTKPFNVDELLDSIHTQLRKRVEFNEAANRRLEDLRKNITTALPHELRTPLGTILGFSEMLTTEAQRLKPDQVADWAGHINRAGHRLHSLVENYLYYVRLQVASQSEANLQEYRDAVLMDISTIVESETVRIAHKYNRYGDLDINIKGTDQALQIGYQDAVKIVDELVDNAFKFSEAGKPVTIADTLTDTHYELTIQDQGRGITREQIEAIGAYMQFDRWFYEQQGMGLGLAIVMQLTHLYDGELTLEGDGKGTIARLRLRLINPG